MTCTQPANLDTGKFGGHKFIICHVARDIMRPRDPGPYDFKGGKH